MRCAGQRVYSVRGLRKLAGELLLMAAARLRQNPNRISMTSDALKDTFYEKTKGMEHGGILSDGDAELRQNLNIVRPVIHRFR